MNFKFVGFLLFGIAIISLPGLAQDKQWSNETVILEQHVPQKIMLNASSIESLLDAPLTLNDCVAIALKNNVQLQIDRLEYNRVYYTRKGAKQVFLPDISLSAQRNVKTDLDSLGNDGKETTADQVDVSLTETMPLGGSISFTHLLDKQTDNVSRLSDSPGKKWTISFTQPLLKGFGYSIAYSDVKVADLDLKIEEYNLQNSILTTIFLVKEAYFTVLQQKKLVQATEAAIERDKKLKAISQAKADAKIATRRDILSAEIILQQDIAELVSTQADFEDAFDNLKDAMGVEIKRQISLAAADLEFKPIPLMEQEWLEIGDENNIAIQLQKATLEKNKFLSKLSGNSRLPDLSVVGTYSQLNDNNIVRDSQNRDLTGKIMLSYPLFNLGARASHQRALIAARQSERVIEDTRRALTLGVRSIVRSLRNGAERINILLKNIDAAKEKVEFATTMFNLGRASNLDITDAQKDLLDGEVKFTQELSNYYIEQARLEQILGGQTIIE